MIDIYLITNLINGKQYVGKTQRGYLIRFKQHCEAYNNGNRTYISRAINKYGKENFKVELIKQVEDDSWEYWENYYIKYYNTHYTVGGYNITWGGDCNPMDIPVARQHHLEICQSEEFREKQRKLSTGKLHSEKTKQLCRKNTLENLDICIAGFRKYNESKKTKVGIIENDNVTKIFDSASDACAYCNRPRKEAGNLLKYCDKYNKNGKRAKFYGYEWTLI